MRKTLLAAVCAALTLVPASIAQGAELLYWTNYDENTISSADITGGGGGLLNLTGATLDRPEGMAIDTVTGKLYVASNGGPDSEGQIISVNLDGSGAGVLNTAGAPLSNPEGIAVDPVTRLVYWSNFNNGSSIGFARLDGTGGGALNTAGATLSGATRMALDPVGGRVYWVNSIPNPQVISFANVNNSGGGDLSTTGAAPPTEITGLAADPAGGRLYLLENSTPDRILFANLNGTGGGDLTLPGSAFDSPFGIGFDPTIGRLYWGNYGNGKVETNAIGFAGIGGGGGGISIATAPVAGPQDPLILKSPTGTGAPAVTRSARSRASLSCSNGTWAADFAGSYVYQAPTKFAYQWTRNGVAVAGAVASTLNARTAGTYGCIATATNQAGSATQTSAGIAVKAAKLKLTVRKKVAVKPGRLAKLKLRIANVGDVATGRAQICLKTGKRAKALKALKCKKLGPIPGGAKLAGTLRLKVSPVATGTYRVKLIVKGAPAKPAKARILVR